MAEQRSGDEPSLAADPVELPRSIPALIGDIARRSPDAPALSDGVTVAYSYAELQATLSAVATWLAERHGSGGHPVALLMDHEPEAIAAELAIISSGNAVMPLDPQHPDPHLRTMLAKAEPAALICSADHQALARSVFDGTVHVWGEVPRDGVGTPPTVDESDPAFLLFTSGSTGEPKGVVLNHRAFTHGAASLAGAGVFGPGDKVAMIAPLSFAAAGAQTMWVLLGGAQLCLFDVRRRGLPGFVAWMREASITALPTQSSLGRAVAAVIGTNPVPTLRTVVPGGESIHPDDVGLFRSMGGGAVRIVPVYVSTEMMLMAWRDIGPDVDELDLGVMGLDRPVDGIDLDVEPLPGSELEDFGEIVVRSIVTSGGYWRDPALTELRFQFDLPGDRMTYRTGDLGRRHGDQLEIVGRSDSMVKVKGARVEIGAVEAAIAAIDSVNAAAVVAAASGRELVLVAHVTSADADHPVDPVAVRGHLRLNLPSQMVPLRVVVHEELPRLANGKVDRVRLAELARGELAAPVPPRTETERRVLKRILALTDLDEIGVEHDLFQLGVDSLVAIEIIIDIEREFGVSLEMSSWIAMTTVADLASEIDRRIARPGRSERSVVELQPGHPSRPGLLIVNDLHGSAFRLADFARALGEDQPVWGTDSPLLGGRPGMPTSLEEVAAIHVADLRRLQAHGPYHVVGYSSNVMLAIEIARQLDAMGEAVGFVGLVDFGPVHLRHAIRATEGPRPPGGWPVRPPSDRSLRQRVAFYADQIRGAGPGARLATLCRNLNVGKYHDLAVARLDLRNRGRVRPELRGAFCWYGQMAMALEYRPPHTDRPAVLFVSDTTAKGRVDVSRRLDHQSATDPLLGWGDVLTNVRRVEVVGFHNDLLEAPYVDALGRQVRGEFDRHLGLVDGEP